MTPRAFLPDYKAVPTASGWRPSYMLFVGDERMVPFKGGPRYFPTKEAAIAVARSYVQQILNPKLRSETMEPANDALSEEARDFLARRDGEVEEERKRVFGGDVPSTVYLRGGRTVAVEMKRRRSA
jgi:hypothetical protein